MLDGFWRIDITDSCGMRAGGMVLLRNGTVCGNGEAIDIAGAYEEHDNALIATLDVVLRGAAYGSERAAERVRLHVQGYVVGHTISASGVDLFSAGRSADVRLERQSVIERGLPRIDSSAARVTEAPARIGPRQDEPAQDAVVRPRFVATRMDRPGPSLTGVAAVSKQAKQGDHA